MTRFIPSTSNRAVPADVEPKTATPLSGPWQADWHREQQKAKLRIAHDGSHYFYNGYRYDRLHDALAYADLMKARSMQIDAGGPHRQNGENPSVQPPNGADLALMARLGITFHDGTYCVGAFRYDRLADAHDHADRTLGIIEGPPR
ncbi:MAG: hypothetical protein AB7P22_20060 [Vicinamibacterales bacterium]